MSDRVADRIRRGLEEAVAIARGEGDPSSYRVHVPDNIDVRRIRRGLGLSQAEFAQRFGFSLDTLKKWEQRQRHPEGPARAYLKVIEHNPKAVEEALSTI